MHWGLPSRRHARPAALGEPGRPSRHTTVEEPTVVGSTGRSTPIAVDFPDADDLHLHLSVGVCRLQVRPGAGPRWVEGAYYDPSGALPVRVSQTGNVVRISQEPRLAQMAGLVGGVPRLALDIGQARPFTLTLDAGAAETDLDLGGVPLTSVTLHLGVGATVVDFSHPHPSRMRACHVVAGAGSVAVKRLANARCASLSVEGGAAALALDFGGHLSAAMTGRINVGMASVAIALPAATAATISTATALANVTRQGYVWQHGAYWTPAALAGRSPVLSLRVAVTLAALTLTLDAAA